MDRIHSSGAFDEKDPVSGHVSVELDLASGKYILHVARTSDAVDDIAFLLTVLADNSRAYNKKMTFDDLFADIIKNNAGMTDDALKELKIKPGSKWMTVYIKYTKDPEENIRDILIRSLPKKVAVAAYNIKDDSTILLVEIPSGTSFDDMVQYIDGLYQVLETEFGEKINIGIGTVADTPGEAKTSSERAKKAADFGRLQAGASGVYRYDDLGPAKIVSNLSKEDRERILGEASGVLFTDLLDNELQKTIRAYFHNNLNTSETARSLYIHRNTLLYRMEKIQKLTGLDLNDFDDAVYLRMMLLLKAMPD